MSYEGYYQVICKKGHYHTVDCNLFDFLGWKCPTCGSDAAWCNGVDLTNGSWDENGKRIDGYVELKPKHIEKCDKCGHAIEELYEI